MADDVHESKFVQVAALWKSKIVNVYCLIFLSLMQFYKK